ncbi:DUF3857 domain-containing protein [Flammeovirga yaeyamensis]|uniref:DUF3857 domain-containing protein n=2 Tax=Flammeovirga yaeyamensis TaxID=367791 RepID=A0AAX1NCZ6_9BACT|nr:transglutaminase-like domain-containing protein [Flammeovirga yaeyamensis]MBB3699488.1 transglutaminase-like putative cysteine protease [Flammeovirga yaeyamensis]NMF35255.1 transglutaminase domain-containing protein [Flammeovirga yaeyamensis]QWG04115.1 DUF3857 domain-containing protein [Flammeovirga yaeyamensis]
MKKSLLLSLLSLILMSSFCIANTPSGDVIYKKKNTHLTIGFLNGFIHILEKNEEEKQFFDNFEQNSLESIFHSKFEKITQLEASSIVPNNGKTKSVKVKNYSTRDILQRGIFYNDYKATEFTYPQLSKSVIGKMKYTKQIYDAHFIKPFYFQDRYFVENAEYSVTFDKNVKIKPVLLGVEDHNVAFSETKKGNKTTYTWTLSNVEEYKFEKNSPSRSYSSPHILILIESYTHQGKTHQISSGVDDLYRWYSKLVSLIDKEDEKLLQDQLDKIISGTSSKEEAKKAVFYWVQKNIKYIAFEDGMEGFIPRSASEVLTKRYGDCKDMANLLYNFYRLMDVNAHLTWIGTRAKPYTYEEMPCTMTDNHMICSITENDTTLFLDATNPFSDYGMPTSMIQGKEALIGKGATYEIKVVPEISAEKNVRIDSAHITLDGTDLKGNYTTQLTGYAKEEYYASTFKSELKNETKGFRDFIDIGKNNVSFSSENVDGFSKGEKVGRINFEFQLPNYCRNVSNRFYINLNLHKLKIGEKLDVEKRIHSYEEEYKRQFSSIVTFDIPEGYELSYLPKGTSKSCSFGSITTEYQIKDQTIVYSRNFTSDYLLLSPSDFAEWNSFVKEVSEINQENIIIKQTKTQ